MTIIMINMFVKNVMNKVRRNLKPADVDDTSTSYTSSSVSSPCSCPDCTRPVWTPRQFITFAKKPQFAPKQPPDRSVDIFAPKPQYWRVIPDISPRPLLGLAVTLRHPNGLIYLWNGVGDPEEDELYAALERSSTRPTTKGREDDDVQ